VREGSLPKEEIFGEFDMDARGFHRKKGVKRVDSTKRGEGNLLGQEKRKKAGDWKKREEV